MFRATTIDPVFHVNVCLCKKRFSTKISTKLFFKNFLELLQGSQILERMFWRILEQGWCHGGAERTIAPFKVKGGTVRKCGVVSYIKVIEKLFVFLSFSMRKYHTQNGSGSIRHEF